MLDETQKREFDIHAERMIRWLRANGHPHMSIVVDQTHAELLEGQMAVSVPWNKAAEGVGQGAIAGGARLGDVLTQQCQDARVLSSAPLKQPAEKGLGAETAVRQSRGEDPKPHVSKGARGVEDHPLYSQFWLAIHQAMYGKGVRHGGAVTPFMDQPWIHYARMHGIGFLTGQAAKKLEEAASTKSGEAFVNEIRGAMVYLGMALIYHEEVEVKKLTRNMTGDESRG